MNTSASSNQLMRGRVVPLTIGTLAFGFACMSCGAFTIVVDQDFVLPTSTISGAYSNETFGRSQVFTVGEEGTLDTVTIYAVSLVGVHEMRILATSGNVPIGGAAGSTELASTGTFTTGAFGIYETAVFDFSGLNFEVAVGDVYAIEVVVQGGIMMFGWSGAAEGYAGGGSFFHNVNVSIDTWTEDTDAVFFFTTTVAAIPEPSSAALCGLGLAMLVGRRRRR